MNGLLITTLASAVTSVILIALFAVERRRGRRFANAARAWFDRALAAARSFIGKKAALVNRLFFRELLHYLTHHTLSLVLSVVRAVERTMERVVRLNRSKVQALRRMTYQERSSESADAASPHLSAIAEHKRSIELTEAEKEKRKKQALRSSF